MSQLLRSVLALISALSAALLLCEAAARLLDRQPLTALRIPPTKYQFTGRRRLDPAVGGVILPSDIDPSWIDEGPPPPTHYPVDPALAGLAQEALRLGLRPVDVFRIWNRLFVEQRGCEPATALQRRPQPLQVFDPSEPIPFPPYRYFPSTTIMGGMITNSFGWRGPEIPLNKPAGTIRLAFAGASTTVGIFSLPFSYPEYVVHWLNLWAERNAPGVHFDGINAGREGLSSGPIAAVIRQEVLPMEPDLILYYEGANQSLCVRGANAPRFERSRAWKVIDDALFAASTYSQLARRGQSAVRLLKAHGGYEPEKPPSDIGWPAGLDEAHPDVASPSLPPVLKLILDDLESARVPAQADGVELTIGSFVWLARDGLRLEPAKHLPIYTDLNENCWPHRYADIRRWIDLHNHVLEQYAAAHNLPFLHVAEAFPLEPDLFLDAVHLTNDGTRLHAWIVFRELLPIVRAHLQSGTWPRADRVPLSQHPSIGPRHPYTLKCL